MPTLLSLVGPFGIATLLAARGLRSRSLSPSGAFAAFFVGFFMMSVPLRVFGVTMIVFYLAGSRATKVGNAIKRNLEEGHQEAGYRNAWQVLCNSFTALLASVIWATLFSPDSIHAQLASFTGYADTGSNPISWCSTPISSQLSNTPMLSRALILATLGHFSTCLGDTLASELGILSPPSSPPRLVTAPWRKVPPGTNGGMSLVGTAASVGGGLFIGAAMVADLWVEGASCLVEGRSGTGTLWSSLALISLGGVGGFLGSCLDSLLGATLQRSRYSETSKKILTDESAEDVRDADEKVVVISGMDILSNNQVNFVSSLAVASLFGALALDGRI